MNGWMDGSFALELSMGYSREILKHKEDVGMAEGVWP